MTAERNVAIEGTTRFFPARTGKARRNWHEYSIEWRLCGILLHRPHEPLLGGSTGSGPCSLESPTCAVMRPSPRPSEFIGTPACVQKARPCDRLSERRPRFDPWF